MRAIDRNEYALNRQRSEKINLSGHARDVEVWPPHTQHASLLENWCWLPSSMWRGERKTWKWRALSRLSFHTSASQWASPRGECLCDKRRQFPPSKGTPPVCVRIRLVRRAGLTASKIHKRRGSFGIATAESRSRSKSSILLARRIGIVYVRWTLQNIVLRNILGLALHPYCFSLRWCGIRLFYYTIFVANLEKFRLFFPLPDLLRSPAAPPSPGFCDFDSISYVITLLIPIVPKFDDSVVTTFIR